MSLRYGCNPHQGQATFECDNDAVQVLGGAPSMINMLDALNAWQLASELRDGLGLPAAASFKHVSPAGAAVAVPLDQQLWRAYDVGNRDLTPLAIAYVRARGTDPKSSFGDFVALSEPVDADTADYLRGVVSDGVIAPGYEPAALTTLRKKKGGSFLVIEANPNYRPPQLETREVFGVKLTQARNDHRLSQRDLDDVMCGTLTDAARRDLLLGLITLKYTQSNSVAYVKGGQTIGIGAGQQSRVDCTKLAGAKADVWRLGSHPKVLDLGFAAGVRRQERVNWRVRYIEGDMNEPEQAAFSAAVVPPFSPLTDAERRTWLRELKGVSLVSDGFIPFRDNVDHAQTHGVEYIAQPAGSARDDEVVQACRDHGIAMVRTGVRLFHH